MVRTSITQVPVGKIPKEFQRPELDQVKELGYDWDDPRDVVDMFEEKVKSFFFVVNMPVQ